MDYYAVVFKNGEIYHHGIKGQKWGKKNGPPYPIDDDDHSTSEKKAGWRSSLDKIKKKVYNKTSEGYQKLGVSKDEADIAAEKRADIAKKALICIGVAAGIGLGAMAIRYYGKACVDYTIKKGTTIQTLSRHGDRMTAGNAFYTAHRDDDLAKYMTYHSEYKPAAYKKKITATVDQDIKIASLAKQKKAYTKLVKTDPEFAKAVLVTGGAEFKTFNEFTLLQADPKKVTPGSSFDKVQKKFYNELKRQGYSGVVDRFDAFTSGFNTKAEIVFDRSNISNIRVSDITWEEKHSHRARTIAAQNREQRINTISNPLVLSGATAVAGLLAVGAHDVKTIVKNKRGFGKRVSKTDVRKIQNMKSAGYTYAQIAEAVGISPNEVGQYIK